MPVITKKTTKQPRKPRGLAPTRYLYVPAPAQQAHLYRCQLDIETASAITGRSLRTLQRWCRHGIPPGVALAALQAHVFGLLPHPAWRDWRIIDSGVLCHVNGMPPVSPGQLLHVSLTFLQLSELRQQIQQMQRLIDARAGSIEHAAGGAAAVQLALDFQA